MLAVVLPSTAHAATGTVTIESEGPNGTTVKQVITDPQPWRCYNVPAKSLIINQTSLQFLVHSTKYNSADCPDGPVELFLPGESYSNAPTSFMFDR